MALSFLGDDDDQMHFFFVADTRINGRKNLEAWVVFIFGIIFFHGVKMLKENVNGNETGGWVIPK